jgi:hypothetical protein
MNPANPEPVTTGTVTRITNFNEIAIRAPRPGFFVGDCVLGDVNPIVRHYELSQDIPPAPQLLPLGSLTPLPMEILYDILSHLDILSVLDFRSVNQRCTAVVTSSPEFNTVTFFPKAMSAVVNTRCRFYSLARLAACLSDTRCSRCERHFGELLYLITAERVCWSCWRRFRDFIPIIPKVAKDTGLSAETLVERVPHITAVPGRYGEPFPFFLVQTAGPIPISDRRAVVAELERLHKTEERDKVYSDPDPEPDRARLRAPKSAEVATFLGRRFEKPMNLRYVAFLRAPYFDQEAQAFIGGYFCRACVGRERFAERTRYARDWRFPESIWHEPWRRYTREGFLEHIEKHGQILRSVIDGTFAHDSPRGETQTPDDVQWEIVTVGSEQGLDIKQ